MKNGFFVISLDFELIWGVFDVVRWEEKNMYFNNTIEAIPQILSLFASHGIHCTWATVGMLFNRDWTEWEQNFPALLPQYEKRDFSAYNFGRSIKFTGTEKICFAEGLIKKILEVPGQEIGTHTYSHYYCLERGQEAIQFEKDLEKAIEIAERMNIELRSLVFPRNQLQKDYLEICYKLGIKNVRSNPTDWYWKYTTSNNLWLKLWRSGDAYVPLGKKSYSFTEMRPQKGFPLEQKASRFLKPVEGNAVLRNLKMVRIKNEMEKAAKENEIYHLWWHPHNFGERTMESLEDLKEILGYFQFLRKRYSFQSANMAEIGQRLQE